MREKGIISTNQYVWMLFCIITSFTVLYGPILLIAQAGRDAWLSVIFAWFLDVLLAVVYAYMGIRFPGQNMVQYSMTILGKYLGKIVGLMFPVFFLIVSSILLRSLSRIMLVGFFPKTPVEVILIAAYMVIGYAVLKGIEVVARVSEILGPVFLLSLVFLFLSVLRDLQIGELKPQLEHGLYPSLSGTIIILSYISICIIMGMYSPICNHPENGFKAKFIAVSMGALILVSLAIISVGIFSYPQLKSMYDLSFRLARGIQIGEFFERIEALWFMIAIGAVVLTSANMIWAFCVGISQVFSLKNYRPLVLPAVLISYTLGITAFKNNIDILNFSFYSYPLISLLVGTFMELLLFFAALILKKKG